MLKWATGPLGEQHAVTTDECGYVASCGRWRPSQVELDSAATTGPRCSPCRMLAGPEAVEHERVADATLRRVRELFARRPGVSCIEAARLLCLSERQVRLAKTKLNKQQAVSA